MPNGRARALVVAVATATTGFLGCVPVAAAAALPTVTGISPNTGPVGGGTRVTVHGTHLTGARSVHFGAAAGSRVKVVSATQLSVTAPSGAGVVAVRVSTAAGTSPRTTADRFTYVPAPVVTTVAPLTGSTAGGARVHLTGRNFRSVTQIRFGTAPGTGLAVTSSTSAYVTAPSHTAGLVHVQVRTGYGTSAATTADYFQYVAPPPPGSWHAAQLPFDTDGPGGGILGAVVCPDATTCIAVGSSDSWAVESGVDNPVTPLAAVRTGGVWTSSLLPIPPGAQNPSLNRLSCADAEHCTALGNYQTGGRQGWLVETYRNGTWSASGILAPVGINLDGVAALSCPTSASCVAVGTAESGQALTGVLAVLQNGAWSLQTVPAPAGVTDPTQLSLQDVSCVSPTACVAVGTVTTPSAQVGVPDARAPLVATLSGSTWQATTLATPFAPGAASLGRVTCTTSTGCLAFGSYTDAATHPQIFAERSSGSGWQAALTPNIPAGASVDVATITCPSAGVCRATGWYDDGYVAWLLSGGAWTPTPLPVTAAPNMSGTPLPSAQACTAADTCIVVGELVTGTSGPNPLIDTLSAGAWTGLVPPAHNPAAQLVDVSCPVAGSCLAVGDDNGPDSTPGIFAESLTDGAWTQQALPTIPLTHANRNALRTLAVSCAVPTFCAVLNDSFKALDTGGPFVDVLRNGTWSASPLDASMAQVSCPVDGVCVAAGSSTNGPKVSPAVEMLGAASWQLHVLPLPSGAVGGQLDAIACTAATSCLAAGEYVDATQHNELLVERLSGSTWTVDSIPTPASIAPSARISDVSCPTTTSCVAVGHYATSDNDVFEFAATWSAGTWSVTTLPSFGGETPAGAEYASFSVDCSSTSQCTAVGTYNLVGYLATLDGGVWSLATPPDPPGSVRSSLAAVSCPPLGGCVAVGRTLVGPGAYPFIESRS